MSIETLEPSALGICRADRSPVDCGGASGDREAQACAPRVAIAGGADAVEGEKNTLESARRNAGAGSRTMMRPCVGVTSMDMSTDVPGGVYRQPFLTTFSMALASSAPSPRTSACGAAVPAPSDRFSAPRSRCRPRRRSRCRQGQCLGDHKPVASGAGQREDLADHLVHPRAFGFDAVQLLLRIGSGLPSGQLDRDLQARERRSQLMGNVRQQLLLGRDDERSRSAMASKSRTRSPISSRRGRTIAPARALRSPDASRSLASRTRLRARRGCAPKENTQQPRREWPRRAPASG